MNVEEIGAVWRFIESGDVEVLAEYVDAGGSFSNRSAQVIVEALRSKPRKRQNWDRDRRIIMAMTYHKLLRAVDGDAPTMEEARANVAKQFRKSEGTVKRIWEAHLKESKG